MPHQNLLLKSAASKIGGAMDKIKFNGSLSTDELQKIRTDIEEARSDLSVFSSVNQDPTGFSEALGRSIELMDRALQTLDSPNLI
ncbi:hypothetical protein A1359_13750 [Methylomonas lenta]|uniref:Uncharacterized protein n=1 Tax=Methylomonas lenta TaxID=980561 RepID=A0A177N3N7_9GAMM|nr:hypothetical protein [Methylomonas lenta]OAI12596.1 hypothetical protein A1359_13750 [Methylomonas lenta]